MAENQSSPRSLQLDSARRQIRPEKVPMPLAPVAPQEEQWHYDAAEDLMNLALLIPKPEPMYPTMVVPSDVDNGSLINVTMLEKMLSHAVGRAAGSATGRRAVIAE